MKSLETKSWKYLLLFLLSSVVFSFSFNSPATIFAFAASAALIVFVKLWQARKSPKEFILIASFSIISLLLIFLVNIWWLYPIIKSSGDYITSSVTASTSTNFQSLKAVSKSFPVHQILLLRQLWWYGESQHWYEFYKQPFIYILSLVVLFLAILGLIKSKSSRFWSILASLLIMGLFVSKGANPPAGSIFFQWLFNHFRYSEALRNPYEKFGVVFVLPFSFLFAYGLSHIMYKLKGIYKIVLISISFILFIVILVWPIWSGNVFVKNELIKVPSYYPQTNTFFNKQGDLRIFHIPLTNNYNEKYDWGYYGQDPSENLFDRSSLSHLTPLIYTLFYKHLPQISKDKDFPKVLGFLGVRDIVIHHDAINNPEDNLIEIDAINNWKGVSKVKDFDKLTIFQVNPILIRSHFYGIKVNDATDINHYVERILPEKSILEDKFINFDYQKFSSARYTVKIRNMQKPFILIFNETFDRSWTAKVDTLLIPNHFKAYGLVNGWLIEREDTFTVEVKLSVWPWD